MSSCLDNLPPSVPTNPSMIHILQRHRDILYDYTKEFKKTKANLKSMREHAELLNSINDDMSSYRTSDMQEYLLTERGRIDNSHRMADIVLEQAYEAKESLDKQKDMLRGIRGRMTGVAVDEREESNDFIWQTVPKLVSPYYPAGPARYT
ncbi:hypothetical protein HK102_009007 [Quaeritorhiza haematococci]|nr:hypothetical protein HK102_009007 [Quaeritorhiza haematococci]